MGLVNRFFLFLYALAGVVLALGTAVVFLQLVPEHYLRELYDGAMGQWDIVAGTAAAVFLLSVHFLVYSLMGSAKKAHEEKEVILIHSAAGDVKVAVDAVKNMIEKVTRMTSGVRDAKIRVRAEKTSGVDSFVKIGIHIVIGQEQNVAEVSDTIRASVRQHLEQTVGVKDFALDIAVDDISNAAVTKKQRVV
jgi:hypothetical protein